MKPLEIGCRLRAGQWVPDSAFDAWLPEPLRAQSKRFWTRVGVAARACEWLRACGVSSVLDVGSGTGKFCVVGALSCGMTFTGVEQRAYLVEAAKALAGCFGVEQRVNFLHARMDAVDPSPFDALYFYNPFEENVLPNCDHLDETVELSLSRFVSDTIGAEELLSRLPVGAHVVTYNGAGARIPDSFELLRVRMAGECALRLWCKTSLVGRGCHWLECDDGTARFQESTG